jgi:hypothetical protein
MRTAVGISLLGLAYASSIIQQNGLEFANEAAKQANLPLVKLGYSIYQAASYDKAGDVRNLTGNQANC